MSDSQPPKDSSGWSSRGLEGEFALFLLLPLFIGLLAASFLPWPEGRWVIVGAAGLVTALLVWLWLRRTHVRRLELLARALESGQPPDRGAAGADNAGRFGELAALAALVGTSVQRRRQLEHELEELVAVRGTVERVSEALETWAESEAPPARSGLAAGSAAGDRLLASLGRAAERATARSHETQAVARLVRDTVHDAAQRSDGVTAAAERQFVEATSLLTVLREIRRWEAELAAGLDAIAGSQRADSHPDAAGATAAFARARELLSEVEAAASAPLDAASGAASRLTEAVGIHRTLEADARVARVEAVTASLAGVEPATELTEALGVLARDLEAAGERAEALERETEAEIAAAAREIARLRTLLGQVAAALEEARSAAWEPGGTSIRRAAHETRASARRALDRLAEMIGEALARGEKLVQQAERTSSEALRAGDSMLGALDELEGLAARLETREGGPDGAPEEMADAEPETEPEPESQSESPRPLRVLGRADVIEDDEARTRG